MKHTLLIASLLLVTLTACKQQEEPAPAPAPEAAPAVTAPAAAVADVAATTPEFDVRALAGNFTGGSTRIELLPDGSYNHFENSAKRIDGTWTVESNNTHIRLDPNSKSEPDRVYEIVSNDQLKAVEGATGDLTRASSQ